MRCNIKINSKLFTAEVTYPHLRGSFLRKNTALNLFLTFGVSGLRNALMEKYGTSETLSITGFTAFLKKRKKNFSAWQIILFPLLRKPKMKSCHGKTRAQNR